MARRIEGITATITVDELNYETRKRLASWSRRNGLSLYGNTERLAAYKSYVYKTSVYLLEISIAAGRTGGISRSQAEALKSEKPEWFSFLNPVEFESAESDETETVETVDVDESETDNTENLNKVVNNLVELIGQLMGDSLNEERVVELVKEHAPKPEVKIEHFTVSVDNPKLIEGPVDLEDKPRHFAFTKLFKLIQRHNVMLVGPAGGGKTTMGEQLAEALAAATGEDWKFFHCSRLTHESQLLGYNDAGGNFVETEFYRAYTRPFSIFMLDETDATVPDASTALNSAIENGAAPFACGTVRRAENTIFLASANTFGFGANASYCGRYPMDGAFKNRWFVFEFDYDQSLERMLAHAQGEAYGCDSSLVDSWVDRVQSLRKAKDELGIPHIISPRASIQGAKDLVDFSFEELEQGLVWQGLDVATVNKIKEAA